MLEFFAFELVSDELEPYSKRSQQQFLERMGFDVVPYVYLDADHDAQAVRSALASYDPKAFAYPVDGVIMEYDDIYLSMAELLELCRKMSSGELRYMIQMKRKNGDKTPLQQWLGGTSAERLHQLGRPRSDGKSLSRTAQLLCGNKTEFLLVADSGPGETNEKGLIVPRFGNQPENHVSVSLTWESLSELLLLTKTHYEAWLSAWYIRHLDDTGN